MNRLAHLITRVANAHRNMQMDQLVRVAILEGIAGVPVGGWKRLEPPARGLLAAERALPNLESLWFESHDMGLYKVIFLTVLSVVQNRDSAEELTQDIVGGLSRSENTKGGQLYNVGEKIRDDDPSVSHAKGLLRRHASQRAVSLFRKVRKDPESLTVNDPNKDGPQVRDVPTNIDADAAADNALILLAENPAVFKYVHDTLARMWANAPSKVAILDKVIENPNMSAVGIARALGHGENDEESWIQLGAAAYVSRIVREIRTIVPSIILRNPTFRKKIDLDQELAPLGYGNSARWARQAKNLALFLKSTNQ